MMQAFKKFLFLITPNERKYVGLLLIMITVMAMLDMIGVASILPFMAVLTNPDLINTNVILNSMYLASAALGVENDKQFLFALGVLVFIMLVVSLIFKTFTTYAQVRFVQMREYSIGRRLIEGYLNQPYSWFLGRNSADLGKTILSEVEQLIENGIKPLIEIFAKGIVIIALITLLVIVDPYLSLVVSFSLGGSYLIIFYFARTYLDRIGKKRLLNNERRFRTVSEVFGASKEVKFGGLEEIYIKRFSNSAQTFAKSHASSIVVANLPRFILEAIAFGGILLLILFIMHQTGSFNSALPIISLYALAGYRLMPALQTIYVSFTQITFIGPSINKLYDDLKDLKPLKQNLVKKNLYLNETIKLKNIYYNYPNSTRTALNDVNLSINAKSSVGLIGITGSGKTTLVDIILGLLEPQKGTLEVDGNVITSHNLRSWQKSIGYVPQHIYLADDTIAANIAFGKETEDIDNVAVEKASRIAYLHDFVSQQLPKKYQTIIGERGVRLSGGQRQRIGIARALYHDPKILILDEATSALDNQTEKEFMKAVNNLSKNITIIIIAHRLSTVKNCDKIYLLDNGKIKEDVAPEELFNIYENLSINTRS